MVAKLENTIKLLNSQKGYCNILWICYNFCVYVKMRRLEDGNLI